MGAGDLESWRPGELETWRPEDLETWRHGELETSRVGDLETLRGGELETWRLGELESWRPGVRESWRVGEHETWRAGDFEQGFLSQDSSARNLQKNLFGVTAGIIFSLLCSTFFQSKLEIGNIQKIYTCAGLYKGNKNKQPGCYPPLVGICALVGGLLVSEVMARLKEEQSAH